MNLTSHFFVDFLNMYILEGRFCVVAFGGPKECIGAHRLRIIVSCESQFPNSGPLQELNTIITTGPSLQLHISGSLNVNCIDSFLILFPF